MRFLSAAAGLATLLTLTAPAMSQSPDPGFYYKLSTEFRGPDMSMDVFNGGPKNNQARLDRDQDVSGQNWRFAPTGDGSFRLTTEFRGPRMCLDINPPTNRAELRPCGNYTGQFWQIVRSGDSVRLTTAFRGPRMCLDIDPDNNQPELRSCGDYSGQAWTLTRTDSSTQ